MAIATFLVVGMASPGSALDVGLGGAGGSVGGGASLGGGVQAGAGAAVGGGASPGGSSAGGNGGFTAGGGGVQAGAGATLGGTSASVGAGAAAGAGGSGTGRSASSGGAVGGIGIGANASVGQTNGVGTGRGAAATGMVGGAVSGGVSNVGIADGGRGASSRSGQGRSTASLGRAASFGRTADLAGEAISLPGRLLPVEIHESGSPAPRAASLRSVIPMRPAYRPILSACRAALAEAAQPYGATKVDVAVTGAPRKSSDGGLSAPVEARIVYSRSGRVQVRQARVTCQFDVGGQVVAAI
jgi:hypothetical protein